MNNKLFEMTLKLTLTLTVFAGAAQAETVVCRLTVPNGTDLILTLTDSNPKAGFHDSLFGGRGSGTAQIRPVNPLKLPYPTQFTVYSNYSKRYARNIYSDVTESGVSFSLVSDLGFDKANLFTATIKFGGPQFQIKYQADCQM